MTLYRKSGFAASLLLACCCTFAVAQDKTPLPDAPSDAQAPKKPEPVLTGDGKVVLEAPIPEPAAGDAIFAPLATAGPDTFHRKLMAYVYVTYGPRAVVSPAIAAAIKQAFPNKNYPPEWQRGIGAFGRNYGNDLASKVTVQTARFAVGAALHEDFRYRPTWGEAFNQTKAGNVAMTATGGKSNRNVPERVFHAVAFTFVDRSDSGHYRLAVANFSAAAAGGFVGNAWLPDGFNDASHGATRMGSRFGSFAFQNVTREFSPEIFHLFKTLHLPFPRLPIPEWWDGTKPYHHP